MNFKKETLSELKRYKKTWDDVRFVQNDKVSVKDLETFLQSMDFEYDDGFGGIEIEDTLIIAGDDWWLERHEYDGSEWWEFKQMPRKLKSANVKIIDSCYRILG